MAERKQQSNKAQEDFCGMLGRAIAEGDEYTAGAIGYAALLGGVNLNQALSGGE